MQKSPTQLGLRVRAWFQSLNAKLFILMALLTTTLTIAVAIFIVGVFQRSIESYAKDVATRTALGVIDDIARMDPELKFRRETAEILSAWANPESVHQIDIFTAAMVDGEDYVDLWATSADIPHAVQRAKAEILHSLAPGEVKVDLITSASGRRVWQVYAPISYPDPLLNSRNTKVVLRAYCNLDRWDMIWDKTLAFTIRALPFVLILEFVLLWLLTSTFVRRPMQQILGTMKMLGEGDLSARARLNSSDELGQIAGHFDVMAEELQKISQEREVLLEEIKGFNSALQTRINDALAELKDKNTDLELLLEHISILREELSQQERLAIAGQLTSAFAHEVGTPLNLVNSHLQLLINDASLDKKTCDRLGTIHSQIIRVGEIVKKLLGLARPILPKFEDVLFPALIAELQRLWAPTLSARKVTFHAQFPDPCLLHADRKQLEQLFINLVNNSVDAMPLGGSINLVLHKASRGWEFSLTDTGVGIPQEIIAKVFKPMFTTKPEGKGTGLGLAICREIIRAHGGEISIESKEGNGATVKFVLPNETTHSDKQSE
ncbi:MAG: ATP-binding protein [Holophagaceae bacterium]|nr:ATP-binding protein [Holophagaceae bacterium]